MKRILLSLIVLLVSVVSNAQIIEFKDANFKSALLKPDTHKNLENENFLIDQNGDGEIDQQEALSVSYLNLKDSQISDISGLEFFMNLSFLYCDFNQLEILDISKNLKLTRLDCGNNNLTVLDLSANFALQGVNCENNQIESLDLSNVIPIYTYPSGGPKVLPPPIPMRVHNNKLKRLNIKNGDFATKVYFSGNPTLEYICVDDFENKEVQSQLQEYGYSDVVVNSYCNFEPGGDFYTIKGKSYNCQDNAVAIPNLKYNITNGTTTGTILSNTSGEYKVDLSSETSYTLTPQLENPEYYTITPESITVEFPTTTSPSVNDFCITPKSNKNDLEIIIAPSGNPARPGFDAKYTLIYKNKGTTTQSGMIDLDYQSEILDYISSTVPNFNPNNSPTQLSFEFQNLKPFEKRYIEVVFNVNSPQETPAVSGGDKLKYTATITSNQTDQTPNDNTHALRQTIVNSFDPNDKTCLEGNEIRPEMIGQYIHYKIRFENTGTFPAENIVVVDEIDATKFDISTIVPIDASHPYETKITGNKVEFIFQKINLPFDDANNDGYITFKIKTLSTLKLNDSFSNQASIYFDFNFPIVTNKETTTITESHLNTSEFNFNDQLNVYPNPAQDRLTITSKNGTTIQSVTIYNLQGQLVVSIPQVSQTSFDVSNLPKGVYVVKVNTDKGATSTKLVKE